MLPDASQTTRTRSPTVESSDDPALLDRVAQAYATRRAELPAGDRRVTSQRDELIELALPVVARLARRFRGRGEPVEDLEQVARLGLLKSLDRYDPTRGPFGAYLTATVTGEIKRHFRDRTWAIRVPRQTKELTLRMTEARSRLTADLARTPTSAELAQDLEVSEARLREAQESAGAHTPVSLSLSLNADGGAELGDLVGDVDPDLALVDDRLAVASLLCRLPARERQILALRFYGNCTQSEIAQRMGISQMHASRLLSQALGWLRDALLRDGPHGWHAGPGKHPTERLTVRTQAISGAVVVSVSGEIDRDDVEQLRRALLAGLGIAGRRELRVDLSDVSFVDAAGAAALLAGYETARRRGVRLRLVGARRYVARTLALAGLWQLF